MSYSLFLEKQVLNFISKLDKTSAKRIISKLESLKENPFPKDTKRLLNIKDKSFRVRVGDFRILYRLESNTLIIIFLINKRSKVYN